MRYLALVLTTLVLCSGVALAQGEPGRGGEPGRSPCLPRAGGSLTTPLQFAAYANGAEPANPRTGDVLYSTTDQTLRVYNGTIWVTVAGGGGGAFNAITSGTNTTAAMVVGTGASLVTAGTGSIIATTLASAGGNAIVLGIDTVGLSISASPAQTAALLGFYNNGGIPIGYIGATGTAYHPVIGTGDAEQFGATIAGTTYAAPFTAADDTTTWQPDVLIKRHTGAVAASGGALQLLRSRGTGSAQTVVVAGDSLGGLYVGGYDGTDYVNSAAITVEVPATATVGNNRVPTQMRFFTGTNAAPSVSTLAMTIRDDQYVVFANPPVGIVGGGANQITTDDGAGSLTSNAALTYNGTTLVVGNGNMRLGTTGASSGVLEMDGSTSGTITIQPAAAAGTWSWTLPTDDGDAGEYLRTDGNGVTSWVSTGLLPAGTNNNVLTSDGASGAVSETALIFDGTDLYLGPVTAALPIDRSFSATDGVGNNIGTGDLTIAAGLPTGNATGGAGKIGRVLITTSDGTNPGIATAHTAATVMSIGTNVAGTAPWVEVNSGYQLLKTQNAIGTAQTEGAILRNTTAAANGAQQYSPMLVLEGQGWETGTGSSDVVEFALQTRPYQGASATGFLDFNVSLNGGAYNTVAEMYSNGQLLLDGKLVATLGVDTYVVQTSADGQGLAFYAGRGSGGTPANTSFDFRTSTTFIPTSGVATGIHHDFSTQGGFAPTSGTADFYANHLTYTINQTGGANGDITGILVDATETALVGTHTMLDLQVGSATRFAVKNGGAIVTTPTADSTYAAANTITPTGAIMRVAGNGAPVSLTSTPSIADASDGQCVTLEGLDGTNTLTLQDADNLANSGLAFEGDVDVVLGKGDSVHVCYDSGDDIWRERWRALNIDD